MSAVLDTAKRSMEFQVLLAVRGALQTVQK